MARARTDADILARAVAAAPADDAPRAALADELRAAGHEAAALAVLARRCTACGAPEAEEGLFGRTRWWSRDYVENGMNSDTGFSEFGDAVVLFGPWLGGPCKLAGGRAWLCRACRRSAAARKANETIRARKAADRPAPLFDGLEG